MEPRCPGNEAYNSCRFDRCIRGIFARMQASAQIQATIELLDEVAEFHYPADRTMATYFKSRRYIGAKDKAVISEYFYTVLRNKLSFEYLLQSVGLSSNSRRLSAVLLKSIDRSISDFYNGEKHSPVALSDSDLSALNKINFADLDQAPDFVQLNVPEWFSTRLKASLGDAFEAEMRASNEQATTDIRVNTLNSTRKQVTHFLSKANLNAQALTLSPWGLRFDRRVALFNTDAFKQGWFEIQDEGSQLLALVSKAKAGDKVVDFCAGAGGKTLAMAAMMKNKGTIYASDVHTKRLEQLGIRAKRAGVHNLRTHVLSSENDKWVKQHRKMADLVLIDAPCSGTGTWRRSPDSRWNMTSESLENLVKLQASILQSTQRLVKPGGYLLFATCSLLVEENEHQVDDFLKQNKDFEEDVEYFSEFQFDPNMVQIEGGRMRTFPARTGTDGFFVAALRRAEDTQA